jgi:hypothetical protein
MSKNAKNRRLHQDAKARNRTKGYKGPARTAKQHTKKNTWYNKLTGKVKVTAAAAILEGAGSAGE